MSTERRLPKPESLESKFLLLSRLPYDRRAKRKHSLVFGFVLDWYHEKYGDALASVRHVADKIKERDQNGLGLYLGDVHEALTDLVAWGYLEQTKGVGRRASRYIPVWDLVCVRENANATGDKISVRENANACVRENANATGASVRETPNEDPLTGPVQQTGPHVMGSEFEAAPMAPPLVGLSATAADAASGGNEFSDFWKAWPRKHGIKKAKSEWRKVDAGLREAVIAKADEWAAHYAKHNTDKKWIPEPANWLAGERWDEDLPLIHVDGKGAAIAKAKANAPAAKPATAKQPSKPLRILAIEEIGNPFEQYTLRLKLDDAAGNVCQKTMSVFLPDGQEPGPSYDAYMQLIENADKAMWAGMRLEIEADGEIILKASPAKVGNRRVNIAEANVVDVRGKQRMVAELQGEHGDGINQPEGFIVIDDVTAGGRSKLAALERALGLADVDDTDELLFKPFIITDDGNFLPIAANDNDNQQSEAA